MMVFIPKPRQLNDGVYSWKTLYEHSLLWVNHFGMGYCTGCGVLGSIEDFEGEKTSTPLAVA